MGMMIVGAGLLAFCVAGALGLVGLLVHLHFWRKKARGSWLLYAAIAAVVAVLVALAGQRSFSREASTPPSGDDFVAAALAFALFGAAPGLGLAAGTLAILKPRAQAPAERDRRNRA